MVYFSIIILVYFSIIIYTLGEDHPNTIKAKEKIEEVQAKIAEQENQPSAE